MSTETNQTPAKEQSQEVICAVCRKTWIPSFHNDCYEYNGVDMCELCMLSFAMGVRSPEPVSQQHLETVCKMGENDHACAFLGVTINGPACLKGTINEELIDRRLEEGTMTAKGNNCFGPPSFRVIK